MGTLLPDVALHNYVFSVHYIGFLMVGLEIKIIVVVYICLGIIRVAADYLQPKHNQLDYIEDTRWWLTLVAILLWPYMFVSDTLYFYSYYKEHSQSEGLRRIQDFFLIVVLHRSIYN